MAATSETIQHVIEHRVGDGVMKALRVIHGDWAVDAALGHAGELHQGCEEIGSSDAWYMVGTFYDALPKPKLDLPNYETNDTFEGDIINAYAILKYSRDAGIPVEGTTSRAVELRLVSAMNKINKR